MKRIATILASFSLAFFILTASVMLTLSMKWTYRLSRADIVQVEYNLTDRQIEENYNNLIDYMFAGPSEKLEFLGLPMSPQGEFHFKEVKDLFKFAFNGMLASGGLALVLGGWLIVRKRYSFLNWGSLLVFLIPALLSIPVLIDFNTTFIKFHEIAFSNDYWIFDPALDPIIRYLPQSLFLKNTVIILLIIVLCIALIQALRVSLQKKRGRR